MMTLTLMDGSTLDVARTDAVILLRKQSIFSHASIHAPYTGLLYFRGKIIPVAGPIPTEQQDAWTIILKDCAYTIASLPTFSDDETALKLIEDFHKTDSIAA